MMMLGMDGCLLFFLEHFSFSFISFFFYFFIVDILILQLDIVELLGVPGWHV